MRQAFRTGAGGRIDRDRPLSFTFDGRRYQGYAGDTLASALLANDVQLVGRSFKYHRPRGIMAAGSEEPNALVTVDRGGGRVTPNLRATQVELYDGLRARSQNRYPSLRFDLGALAGLASPLLSAGFIYKSFMRPASFWRRVYEPAIRRMAGLGRAPSRPDPDNYAHQFAHCDVLIVGGGPAGLAAALGACVTGARVMLCDEQAELGGSLLAAPDVMIDGWPAPEWTREALETLAERVVLLPRTTAFGWYPGNMIGLVERLTDHLPSVPPNMPWERLWQVRAGRVILATGAIERPMVFPGNDRPGTMLAGAAQVYLHRYGVKVGRRAVVVTADDSGYYQTISLHAGGLSIAGIVDQRPMAGNRAAEAARAAGIPVHAGTIITGTEGRMRVHSVRLSNATGVIPCDTVLMAGGWTPTVQLAGQSREGLMFDPGSGTFLPTDNAVGACAGEFDLAACLRDGVAMGGSEARTFEVTGWFGAAPPGTPISGPPAPGLLHPRAFVDFQNDVTTKDLETAVDEGFVSIEHMKRYTTTGMATDQGKTANLNALATVANLTGRSMDAVGYTTFRPPYTPVTFGAFAGPFRGELYAPVRRPPIALPEGAVLEDVGTWKRARCFPRAGETAEQAVARECLAVRNDVGVFDASTLGKIDVAGPDAAAFLNRIYTGDYTRLGVGRCRYAVMLGEDGCIRDDGIITRLANDRFHVTTTTGGADLVLHHMEDYLQTEFASLRVWLTSVTEQWAVIAVQGPNAAALLAPFTRGIDMGAMPHMSMREGHIGDVPIRLFRVSFTGESGFEINLPPPEAQRVWDTLVERGAVPYGTDAMHVLRAEKGYIIVGQETDGTVTLSDVGLEWLVPRHKGDFVGKRSLSLPALGGPDRQQLVGLLPADGSVVLEEGAQVTEAAGGPSIGHVTSAYYSPTLGRGFALALVAGGRSRIGAVLHVPDGGRGVSVSVTEPVFHDPQGERLRVAGVPFARFEELLPAQGDPAQVAVPVESVTLRAPAPTIRLSVRAGAAGATAIGLAVGVLLPTVPCRSVIARDRAALWVGPDEWLIYAPPEAADLVSVAASAGAASAGGGSITDVSHRTLALEIAGPRATWCLNGYCALDLDMHAFPVGACTRTLLGKAEVMLWRMAGDIFHVDVPRSLFPYVWACLEESRRVFL
ncbi:MAG TPA: sarcosine oxidase subunit alpha family protein [Rhodopila sp.]|nr:sarcosine oxidase subunit alpha family protein [Rhodopila sp.]